MIGIFKVIKMNRYIYIDRNIVGLKIKIFTITGKKPLMYNRYDSCIVR